MFAKMDQVFSEENKTLKKILENWKKNTGKVREFCQSGKVGTLKEAFCVCFEQKQNFAVFRINFNKQEKNTNI